MIGTSAARSWRPDEVRRKEFTVRFRGLDPNEVRGFLNALADDMARLYEQMTSLTQDNAQLRSEQQTQGDLHEQVTEQAVGLLNQAQQLADALIEESMQSARDMMAAARIHQREIVEAEIEAHHVQVASETAALQRGGTSGAALSGEPDDVRMFTKVAQGQFRAVLDALNEQVDRLGEFQSGEESLEQAEHQQLSAAAAGPSDRH